MLNKKLSCLLVASGLLLGGCATTQPAAQNQNMHPYTSGNVSLTLRKDVTTEADVIQAFGAPNIVTQTADGKEQWIYQKNATVQKSSSTNVFATILLAGASQEKSGATQSSRTMTLIIQFAKNKVVSFKSMSTSF